MISRRDPALETCDGVEVAPPVYPALLLADVAVASPLQVHLEKGREVVSAKKSPGCGLLIRATIRIWGLSATGLVRDKKLDLDPVRYGS